MPASRPFSNSSGTSCTITGGGVGRRHGRGLGRRRGARTQGCTIASSAAPRRGRRTPAGGGGAVEPPVHHQPGAELRRDARQHLGVLGGPARQRVGVDHQRAARRQPPGDARLAGADAARQADPRRVAWGRGPPRPPLAVGRARAHAAVYGAPARPRRPRSARRRRGGGRRGARRAPGRPARDVDWLVRDPEGAARALADATGGALVALDPERGHWRVVWGAGDADAAPP
jgi:hypothetical protein